MKYASVCSGLEAASVAWERLGWQPVLLSEIEDFPRAVLAHRQNAIDAAQTDAAKRGTPLWGDFTAIRPRFLRRLGIDGTIDLVVGGTPCQDFSVAGSRNGLDGARGNLTLEFANFLRRTGPRWFIWENVPGCFSTNNGKDFGAVLARFAGHAPGSSFDVPPVGWCNSGIVEPAGPGSYGLAWRVLDAQYVRVDSAPRATPQRRNRVFVIGYFGDWRPAAAVLLERESLSWHSPPRRYSEQIPAQTLDARAKAGGGLGGDTGPRFVLQADAHHVVDVAGAICRDSFTGGAGGRPDGAASGHFIANGKGVRRLTPKECERLQNFPDNYTLIPMKRRRPIAYDEARYILAQAEPGIKCWCDNGKWYTNAAADGPRYKALGNSMAVNCMLWIGKRIDAVSEIIEEKAA